MKYLMLSLVHRPCLCLGIAGLTLLPVAPAASQEIEQPLHLRPGPQLFIDDYLIAQSSFLTRVVNNPQRLAKPVITGGRAGDDNFQPYFTVLRDPQSKRFRMWYNTGVGISQSHLGYLESEDGVNWQRPHRVLKDPGTIKFGASVVDRGEHSSDPAKRFVLGYYYKDGLMIATSPEGLEWTLLSPVSVLRHNHDIDSVRWDPIRHRFLAIVSMTIPGRWEGTRRIPHQSVSEDLLHWKKLWPILVPKLGVPLERGETQFYAMGGAIARGDLLIGLVKVLRDDLNATPGKTGTEMGDLDRKAAGLGYTVLAWSRDGETWQRDYEPFIPNNPLPGSWDHAMAWADEQLVAGDETFVYYAGYARGHKVARFEERQIGLARMPRDRYVSRDADLNTSRLLTKPLVLDASSITVNANVAGAMRVRLLDQEGNPKPSFDWVEIRGDAIAHPVRWKAAVTSLRQTPVRLEFELKEAQLFGFDLQK
jgi:hypothetical protein